MMRVGSYPVTGTWCRHQDVLASEYVVSVRLIATPSRVVAALIQLLIV
jgi:hypothetical protein